MTAMEQVYLGLLPIMAPHNSSRPFIDFFQLTRSCFMDNCSVDGGHVTRFVNRWKAQLLLNTICEVVGDADDDPFSLNQGRMEVKL